MDLLYKNRKVPKRIKTTFLLPSQKTLNKTINLSTILNKHDNYITTLMLDLDNLYMDKKKRREERIKHFMKVNKKRKTKLEQAQVDKYLNTEEVLRSIIECKKEEFLIRLGRKKHKSVSENVSLNNSIKYKKIIPINKNNRLNISRDRNSNINKSTNLTLISNINPYRKKIQSNDNTLSNTTDMNSKVYNENKITKRNYKTLRPITLTKNEYYSKIKNIVINKSERFRLLFEKPTNPANNSTITNNTNITNISCPIIINKKNNKITHNWTKLLPQISDEIDRLDKVRELNFKELFSLKNNEREYTQEHIDLINQYLCSFSKNVLNKRLNNSKEIKKDLKPLRGDMIKEHKQKMGQKAVINIGNNLNNENNFDQVNYLKLLKSAYKAKAMDAGLIEQAFEMEDGKVIKFQKEKNQIERENKLYNRIKNNNFEIKKLSVRLSTEQKKLFDRIKKFCEK